MCDCPSASWVVCSDRDLCYTWLRSARSRTYQSLMGLIVLCSCHERIWWLFSSQHTYWWSGFVKLMFWALRRNELDEVTCCSARLTHSACSVSQWPVSVLNSRAPIFDRVSCSRMLAQLLMSWGCIAGYALRGIWCRNPSCPSRLFLGIGVAALPR